MGANWSAEYAAYLDFWLFVAFLVLFILIHIVVAIQFFIGFKNIRRLKKTETTFLKDISNENENNSFEFFKKYSF